MPKLLLASYNKGKLKELKALLRDLEVELVSPEKLELEIEIAETGNSYAENAALKAQTFARLTGILTLADDSGLEVEVLDNAPGLFSARFNPNPGASDADRRKYLLERLQDHQRPWKAKFRCTVAIAEPDGRIHFTEGVCEGEVIPEERGDQGFGYDPIFYIPEIGKTMAELNLGEKNLISHRAGAVIKAVPIIENLISDRAGGAAEGRVSSQIEASIRTRLLETHLKSRKKLARELHDGPTQAVAALAMRINIIRRLIEQPSEAVIAELDKIDDLARRTTQEMRHVLFALYPIVLENQDLDAALKDLVDKIAETFNQKVWLSIESETVQKMGAALQALIFDILVELVNNARKHTQPENIWVRLRRTNGEAVLLEVEDDGGGFSTAKLNEVQLKREKLGFLIVREWVDIFHGDMTVKSSTGKGTIIQIRIPLKPRESEDLKHGA